jgi:hypothetical protein
MREVANILFGAGFTLAISIALGALLLHRLRIVLYRGEALLMQFICGSSILSFIVALLCCVHAARRGVFIWGGIAVIALAILQARNTPRRKSLPAVSLMWFGTFLVIFSAFFIYFFFNALAPEISPDGSTYHLANVLRIWKLHGFAWGFTSIYSFLSQGTEMLFLVAYSFGRHSAAALVHFAYMCALPWLIFSWGRRFGHPKVGIFAALLVFTCPVVAKDGISAYNDLAVVTLIYAVFYLLQVWDENRSHNLLILIGIISGSAYGVKYTAFLALPFAAVWIWRALRHEKWTRIALEQAFLVGPALLFVAPWVIRNWIWTGNPVAPFFTAWFPNPTWHAGMERIYADMLKHYTGINHYWEIPLQLTIRSGVGGGTLGPVFLLAPFSLFALRNRMGRRLLLAALVFALPAYLNVGTRFLIPCLPFIALALGLALSEIPYALPAVMLFQAFLCWPTVVPTYSGSGLWALSECPVRAALRLDPPAPFITHTIPDYALKVPIELAVPPGERIYSFAGRPGAYIERNIVVSYESSLGNLVDDLLLAPTTHRPAFSQHFKFVPVNTTAIRLVAPSSHADFWTIAELRFFHEGRELARSSGWRISASPNEWEAPFAFDNNYATRWSTWQAVSSRDHIQVEFSAPVAVDEVVVESDPSWKTKPQIEVSVPGGRWVAMTDTGDRIKAELGPGIRRAAAMKIKQLGIRFLLVNEGDFFYRDVAKYPTYWGMTQIAEANGTHFYRID